MLKTILRTVLVILLLAGVFFFALKYWEGKRGAPPLAPAPAPEAEPSVTVRRVTVVPTSAGALLQVEEVAGPAYTISSLDAGAGFAIDVAGAKVGMLQNFAANPHPLIRTWEASQMFAQGIVHSRIRVETTREVTYRDRLQGSTLYVDILPKETAAPAATPQPQAEEATSPPRPAKKEPAAAAKKPVRKAEPKRAAAKPAAVRTPRKPAPPAPRKAERVKPAPLPAPARPAPVPAEDESEKLLRELGLAEGPAAAAREPEPRVPAPPAVEKAAPSAEPAGEAAAEWDPDSLFGETEGEPEPAAPSPAERIPPEEEPPKVAALPAPTRMEKFDSSQVLGNYPALTGVTVTPEGAATVVRVKREGKTEFKVFRKASPAEGSRIVVDFKNSSNQLRKRYGPFAGTKVKGMTTEEFAGPDGTLVRLTIQITGLPKYEKSIEGNDLILRLP